MFVVLVLPIDRFDCFEFVPANYRRESNLVPVTLDDKIIKHPQTLCASFEIREIVYRMFLDEGVENGFAEYIVNHGMKMITRILLHDESIQRDDNIQRCQKRV